MQIILNAISSTSPFPNHGLWGISSAIFRGPSPCTLLQYQHKNRLFIIASQLEMKIKKRTFIVATNYKLLKNQLNKNCGTLIWGTVYNFTGRHKIKCEQRDTPCFCVGKFNIIKLLMFPKIIHTFYVISNKIPMQQLGRSWKVSIFIWRKKKCGHYQEIVENE